MGDRGSKSVIHVYLFRSLLSVN